MLFRSMGKCEDEKLKKEKKSQLCVGGDCIEILQQTSAVLRVIPFVKVATLPTICHWFSASLI